MPSLTDSLEQLNTLSNQIQQLSRCNCRPSGPYTTAYLGPSVVPDLIRDGSEAEKRLFKFIGETDSSIKKVEKREGLVTPLKDLKAGRARGGQDETNVVLRAVAKLVDDYRPMPRARAHISGLAERHEMQMERIAALERQIAELRNPSASGALSKPVEPPSPTPPAPKPKATLSPDEAIKAEEESIRALGALIRPHREAAIAAEYASPQKITSPEKPSAFQPQSPPPGSASRPSAFEAQTPARTPARETFHHPGGPIFGATPHRSTKINRFTPLKNLATPRTRERGSIFGSKPRSVSGNKRLTTVVPTPLVEPLVNGEDDDNVEGDDDDEANAPTEDETVRIADGIDLGYRPQEPASPTPDRSAPAEEVDLQMTPKASPQKLASPIKGPRLVDGVLVDSEAVQAAISLIQNTMSDLLSHGTEDETADAAGIVAILHRVSISDAEEVPSSGSSVASSSATGPAPPPVTKEAILQAHLLLMLLRSADLRVLQQEAKSRLSAILAERGWDKPEPSSTILGLTGKRTLYVDNRVPGGPRNAVVSFR